MGVKKDTEITNVEALHGSLARLEQTLNNEVRRRMDAFKSLQTTFEAQVAMVQDKLESTFLDRYDHLHSVVEAISDRMNIVEKDFSQSRESYISDMEEKSKAVDNDLISFKKAFEDELRVRAERESQLHKKITMLEAKTSEKFEHERQICD